MDKIDEVLNRGVERIYPTKEALEKALRSGRRLKLYLGCDARRPILHLGHGVALKKLRQFQDLGHKVIFLIGDFTTLIGDPSDQKQSRSKLTPEQVKENTKTFKRQAAKVVRFEGENAAEVKYNSEWLAKLTLAEILNLASHFTVPQLLERDMFQERLKEGKPLYVHEILYPLMQAYDSVAMDVNMEIGGADQTFNMLCGRHLMKVLKGKEKLVLSIPLLTGTDGEKMSKSLDNYIPLEAPPNEMFGKIMSMQDSLINQYIELCTDLPSQSSNVKTNPMETKKRLAWEIVKIYHGETAASKAQNEFEQVFQKGKLPTDHILIYDTKGEEEDLADLLVKSGLAPSRSEAKRLIGQGAVEIDKSKINPSTTLRIDAECNRSIKKQKAKIKIKDGMIVKVGKYRFAKIRVSQS